MAPSQEACNSSAQIFNESYRQGDQQKAGGSYSLHSNSTKN